MNSFFKENGLLNFTFWIRTFFFCITIIYNLDIVKINFIKINLNRELIKNLRTPAGLESIILKQYKFNSGDFIFYEWDKLSDEILVTTERSALITKFTCKPYNIL